MILNSDATVGVVKRSLRMLPRADKGKLLFAIGLQIILGFADLIAVAMIGILGALAVSGIQSQSPTGRIAELLEWAHLTSFSFQMQVALIGLTAGLLLIFRTIFSVYISKRVLYFLSHRGAEISRFLLLRLFAQPILFIQEKTIQERVYSVSNGVQTITLGVIGAVVNISSDLVILIVLGLGLFIVNPAVATGTAIFFILIGAILHFLMSKKSNSLGFSESQLQIESSGRLYETFLSYRELVVSGRRRYFADQIAGIRASLSARQAELSFMPSVSKYVIEAMLVVGALIISGSQFFFSDAKQAVATLAIFLAAGTRIAPAVLRVQQGLIGIRSAIGSANPTLDLMEDLEKLTSTITESSDYDGMHNGCSPTIVAMNVSYSYPKSYKPTLTEVSLRLDPGEVLAIVGPSGSGKTTLVDLLLGVLDPTAGSVLVSGLPPLEAFAKWPGSAAYVTQDTFIADGTFRSNVAFGYPLEVASDEKVVKCLQYARLLQVAQDLPGGIDSPVGEGGSRLSGGQKQRLGIARALFTNPKILVLDEATSALDAETEELISQTLRDLKGKVTIILIAHRLSSVQAADKVAYVDNGRILCLGSFEQVREAVPDFDKQAKLMGL